MKKTRILFYSHDSFGLGHFRRSLTIASFLVRHIKGLSVLMLTGLDSAASFEAPRGVDFVKLPSIWKAGPDQYQTRHLRVSFARVHRMRAQLVRDVVRAFDPMLFVVDNVPLGVDAELMPTLKYLKKKRPHVRIVLTMRDVLDTPDHICPRWREIGVYDALEDFYDEIWIAGCRALFDPVTLYQFPPRVARRARFCGYVVRSVTPGETVYLRKQFRLEGAPVVVASCGGGGDGYPLLDAFAGAARPLAADGIRSVVFLGPDMPPEQRRDLKERLLPLSEYVTTFDYRPDLVAFLDLASATVSMAGYNTTCELVAMRKRAAVVPRVYPRFEQLLRAQAFERHGLMRVVHPDVLDAGELEGAVRCCLEEANEGSAADLPEGVDFAGLSRITRRVRKHLELEQKGDEG
ncbi:MAG: hypothetical protein D6760_12560 [Deltaproteobacteria bacterium]|nr:MAG: hypothetical protein D6760_12560 [Deltaproteobacteria bacterium]